MAVIEVPVSPSAVAGKTGVYVRNASPTNPSVSVSPSNHVVQFDLSLLGTNPVIRSAVLLLTSTHSPKDSITVVMGNFKQSCKPGAVDVTAPIKEGISSATLTFYGFFNNLKTQTIYANITIALEVTIDGEDPGADLRSTATIAESSVNFGETVHMTVATVRESYTPSHNYMFSIGDHVSEWKSFKKDELSVEFTVPAAWMDALPSSSSGTLTITLDTLDNGQSVGTRDYTITVTVPEALKPTMSNVSYTVVNPSTLTGNEILTGVTRLQFTIGTLTGSTGASIASIRYAGWGDAMTVNKPASTSGITQLSTVVQQTGALELRITATDTRGRTVSTVLTTAPATPYEPPSFTSVSYLRCAPDGTPLERGSTAKVRAAFKCDTTAIAGNTVSGTVSMRQDGASQWLIKDVTLVNNAEMIFDTLTLDTMLSYEIVFAIKDNVMSAQRVVRLPALQYMLHFSNNGRSIGVGQVAAELAETDNGRLTVNPDWTVAFGQNVMIGSQTLAEYIQSIVTAMQGS